MMAIALLPLCTAHRQDAVSILVTSAGHKRWSQALVTSAGHKRWSQA
jgi:hypothetical protein